MVHFLSKQSCALRMKNLNFFWCLILKVGLAEFSLDVLMQYEFFGFCRLGLNRMKLYGTKT